MVAMDHPVLQVAMRYLHVASFVMMVGGMLFISLCLKPAYRILDDAVRDKFAEQIRQRFMRLLQVGVVGLAISGVYNWMMLAPTYKAMGPVGNALIGAKVLLAVVLFAIVWLRALGVIKCAKATHMINLHLAAIIILLAAILRYLRLNS